MEQSPLKLKLKLGGSGTPEASPRSSSQYNSRMAEDPQQMISDDDQEEEELDQEGQEDEGNMEEEGRSRSRHSHNDDAGREKHKKSKKKKKKKEKEKEKERHKHRHHRDKEADEDEPPNKMSRKSVMDDTDIPTSLPSRKTNKETAQAFHSLLEHLCLMLEKKDPQQFFAYPVSDNIAPGYSSIIKRPMDFATMHEKIDNMDYRSLPEFITDFRLMCNNCMKYNGPDTIYYRAAKKLLHLGERMLTGDKIAEFMKDLPSVESLSKEQLGLFGIFPGMTLGSNTEMDEEGESQDGFQVDNDSRHENSMYEVVGDDMSSEEILDQAQEAAAGAREKLTAKKPSSALGFLRQHGDGTTTLNFLTGCEGNDPAIKEKPVTLGLLTGKLTQGTTNLYNYREDKRNMAKPVKPLYYGAFSSFCPTYDSTFANLSKEESEMVYATYGNETHVQYAESIMEYSKDCDMAMHLVDQLLNLLTHQQHSRTKAVIQERRRLQEEEERITSMLVPKPSESSTLVTSQEQKPNDEIDFKSLKTLTELGIDTSFLGAFETKAKQSASVDKQLSANANLLESLAREQYQRLSKPPPNNLNNLPQPTPSEVQLAEKVTDGLRAVAKQVTPGSLAPTALVRRAMGITSAPV
ncbi:unnamed protein product, partial [Meganyctiphanes norvegica]